VQDGGITRTRRRLKVVKRRKKPQTKNLASSFVDLECGEEDSSGNEVLSDSDVDSDDSFSDLKGFVDDDVDIQKPTFKQIQAFNQRLREIEARLEAEEAKKLEERLLYGAGKKRSRNELMDGLMLTPLVSKQRRQVSVQDPQEEIPPPSFTTTMRLVQSQETEEEVTH